MDILHSGDFVGLLIPEDPPRFSQSASTFSRGVLSKESTMEEQPDAEIPKPTAWNVRPPDIVKPSNPPSHPPQESAPSSANRESPVKVRVRTGGDEEDVPKTGMAPFNTRVIAMLIDGVVAAGWYYGAILILPGFAHKLAVLLGLGYIVTRDSLPFLGGQGVGKKAMKLRAVTLEGESLTGKWEVSLIRSGVLLIPFFQLVELWILLTREDTPERGRRLGDEWAKTKVIIEEKPVKEEPEA
jgi:uncharacterized RDD family membrane protein YckC